MPSEWVAWAHALLRSSPSLMLPSDATRPTDFNCLWGCLLACCAVTSKPRTYGPSAAARCIDLYIEQRQKSDVQGPDERLASIVQRMFQR